MFGELCLPVTPCSGDWNVAALLPFFDTGHGKEILNFT